MLRDLLRHEMTSLPAFREREGLLPAHRRCSLLEPVVVVVVVEAAAEALGCLMDVEEGQDSNSRGITVE